MTRKKKAAHAANHERWLVSYADFITLLFAFFVVMFASSQTDRAKVNQVSESVKKALEENQIATAIAGILGGTVDDKGKGNAQMRGPGGINKVIPQKATPPPPNARYAELVPSQQYLNVQLKEEIATGKVQVSMEARGLVVTLRESAFFPVGDDTLAESSYEMIGKIAAAIRSLPNPVRLEGHTDSIPIHNRRFRSNWELSAARAIAMLEILEHRYEMPPGKLAIAGYADSAPVDSNDTPEGRARNRRVDVVILNQQGMLSEPSAPSPAAGAPTQAPASEKPKPMH